MRREWPGIGPFCREVLPRRPDGHSDRPRICLSGPGGRCYVREARGCCFGNGVELPVGEAAERGAAR